MSIPSIDNNPQINPNELLNNILDHIHDNNREELIGSLILMLGWLHKKGQMPIIYKDDQCSNESVWIVNNELPYELH